ncbi:MAG: trehalose-6-phosphate synthase, partial [Burkholderiaceae bacterium]
MPFRSFRLSLRFVLPLALVLGLFAYAIVPLVDELTQRWFVRDLDSRSLLLANAMEEPLREYLPLQDKRRITQLFDRAIQDDRLFAVGYCDNAGNLLYKTITYPKSLGCRPPLENGQTRQSLVEEPAGQLHVTETPVKTDAGTVGKLLLLHDMGYIERRSDDVRLYIILLFAVMALVISLITVFIAHLSWRGWINAVKGILRGGHKTPTLLPTPPELQPLESDLRALLHEFTLERRTRDDGNHLWTPDKLRLLLHDELAGDEILVVSNREPYIHEHTRSGIEVRRPASGLVTAVEPVMRACSGTWIAHGSGSADRDSVDRDDRVQVPPQRPGYTLRRVWLTKEEEQG